MTDTNQLGSLAQNYYHVVIFPFSSDLRPSTRTHYQRIRDLIAENESKIKNYYKKHRSLRGLEIEGLPKVAKRSLDLMLRNGLEAAVGDRIDRRVWRVENEEEELISLIEALRDMGYR